MFEIKIYENHSEDEERTKKLCADSKDKLRKEVMKYLTDCLTNSELSHFGFDGPESNNPAWLERRIEEGNEMGIGKTLPCYQYIISNRRNKEWYFDSVEEAVKEFVRRYFSRSLPIL